MKKDKFLSRLYTLVFFVSCIALLLTYINPYGTTTLFDIFFFYTTGTIIWYMAKVEYEKVKVIQYA